MATKRGKCVNPECRKYGEDVNLVAKDLCSVCYALHRAGKITPEQITAWREAALAKPATVPQVGDPLASLALAPYTGRSPCTDDNLDITIYPSGDIGISTALRRRLGHPLGFVELFHGRSDLGDVIAIRHHQERGPGRLKLCPQKLGARIAGGGFCKAFGIDAATAKGRYMAAYSEAHGMWCIVVPDER